MDLQKLTCPACGFPTPEILRARTHFQCPACGCLLVLTDLQEDTSILCPTCQTINADTRQRCSGCGKKLKINCPFCYASNPIGNINCNSCGVNLQTAQKRKKDWIEENNRNTEARLALTRRVEAESQKARLKELINDLDEPNNHSFAIYCLTQMGKTAGDALIETLQNDPDPDARFGAAIALGNIQNQTAVPALMRALQDPESVVRYWAIDALQKFATVAATTALQNCLEDPHRGVKNRAREALTALGIPVKKSSWWPFG